MKNISAKNKNCGAIVPKIVITENQYHRLCEGINQILDSRIMKGRIDTKFGKTIYEMWGLVKELGR
jgi:hypothetical protein